MALHSGWKKKKLMMFLNVIILNYGKACSSKKKEEMRQSNKQAHVSSDTDGDNQQIHFKW